tara:strand:+ start:158 stop:2092 length:1935 start_codon:yes stop_codon:yes gene_type:complete
MSLIKLKKIDINLRIVTLLLILIAVSSLSFCSQNNYGSPGGLIDNDVIEDLDIPTYTEDVDVFLWTPDIGPEPECLECKWYFCPPLNEVWKKEICMNICDDPPTLHSEADCIQYMECDPSQYVIDTIDCITEDGYPGTQQKVCNKGLIQYTDCVTSCEEEACNYEDDDCDGEIDEGQLNDCEECGIVPYEVCDGIDDDCDGSTDENLIQACSTACGAGYETCFDGNWISCTAPPEKEEICDGLDNDCDGSIDEELECICTIQDIGALFPCQEAPLLCGQGYKTCECVDPDCKTLTMTDCYAICYWIPPVDPSIICDPLIGMPLNEEKCNNFDDNCNQEIDEDLYSPCYTGPEGTIMVGICVPGEMTCETGTWGSYDEDENFIPYYCDEEITPQEEICNGLDDDCDGIADWGDEMKETDVLFIVDWSGSMGDEIDAVMIALNQFAQNFSDEEVIKWAFVRGPVAFGPYDERLEMIQDLIGFSDFLASLATMDTSLQSMSTAFEMLLDAIYISVHNITATLPQPISSYSWGGGPGGGTEVVESVPPLQNFDISWRPSADRIIIVFSDEVPQSYLIPELSAEDVKTAVSGVPQLKLFTFSRTTGSNLWEELAIAGNGSWYKLTNNPTEMYASLMEIIDEICKGGSDE